MKKKLRESTEKLYREGKLSNKPKQVVKDAPVTKRKMTISSKTVYDKGELGVTVPQSIPLTMPIGDYIKSVLYMVDPVTGKTAGDRILAKQVERAIQGDKFAADFLFDRAYGKATQTVQVNSPPAIHVEHSVISVEEVKNPNNGLQEK